MEIWLDTIDRDLITLGNSLGIISGITTNPSLIADPLKNVETILSDLLKLQDGPIAVQVTATTYRIIIEQAERLRDFSEKIIIKIPVTQEGLKATAILTRRGFPIMSTAVFTPFQALFACQLGVHYIAPYYSQIEKAGGNPSELFATVQCILNHYDFDTKILAASLKDPDHILDCLDMGIDSITLKKELFETLLNDNPLTLDHLKKFSKDWDQAKPSNLL